MRELGAAAGLPTARCASSCSHGASTSAGTIDVIWLAVSLVAFWVCAAVGAGGAWLLRTAHDALGAKPLPARRRDVAAVRARNPRSPLGRAARPRAAGGRPGNRRACRAALAAGRPRCWRGASRPRVEPEMVLAARSEAAAR